MEQMTIASGPDGRHFYVEPLQPGQAAQAAALCDRHVGKNLYHAAELAEIPGSPDRFFFFLRAPDGKTAGYFYFYLSDLQETAAYLKMEPARLAQVSDKAQPLFVNLRSIGIEAAYRGRSLSTSFVAWALDFVREHTRADVAAAVCWKPNGVIQVKNIMQQLHFRYFADLPRFWYHVEDLHCPVCKGRCRCDAVFYYKALRGGTD